MKKLVLSGVAAAALIAGPAAAASYSVYDQFAVSGGVITAADFAFGYAGSTYAGADTITAFETIETPCAGDANLQCARSANGSSVVKASGAYDPAGTPFFDAGELNLHPGAGNETTVVQFIVPISGLYSFAGAFTANDTSPNSIGAAAYVAGVSQIANARGSFSFDANLTAGQKVSFALGSAGDYTFDSTGFALNVTGPDASGGIPEPETWALMILGFAGAGATLRARRRATLA
jgi:hypothetical protein